MLRPVRAMWFVTRCTDGTANVARLKDGILVEGIYWRERLTVGRPPVELSRYHPKDAMRCRIAPNQFLVGNSLFTPEPCK